MDENGTEAAAATAVLMTGVSAQGGTDQLVADRPFLYVIRDVPTGTPLFIGRVTTQWRRKPPPSHVGWWPTLTSCAASHRRNGPRSDPRLTQRAPTGIPLCTPRRHIQDPETRRSVNVA